MRFYTNLNCTSVHAMPVITFVLASAAPVTSNQTIHIHQQVSIYAFISFLQTLFPCFGMIYSFDFDYKRIHLIAAFKVNKYFPFSDEFLFTAAMATTGNHACRELKKVEPDENSVMSQTCYDDCICGKICALKKNH